jgi:arylsulfatase A-like enzyme
MGAAAGATFVLPGCTGWTQERKESKKRPNIIVIVGDDMGYADIGCHGCKDIATPNIDSIAQNGVRFTNGYVSCPVCSPTRAGLVTGRYQQRFGHEFNPGAPREGTKENVGLPLTEVTIANVLKSAGYATGIVGKWHLGNAPHFHPLKRGFDEYFGFLGGSHSYTDPGLGSANPIMRGTEPVNEKEYLTDAFTREAMSFIERHKDKPFFLYLTYNAVHSPLEAPERYKNKFENTSDPKRRVYAGMMTAMDEGIGKVLGKLRDLRLEEDTLIFFISDNGGPTGNNGSNNSPLRATKATVYEGGIRVPFMIQWPRRLKGGKVVEIPVIALDILPTAAAAAGAQIPKDRKIDGVNLLPYISGEKKGTPHEMLFWRMGQNHAIRKGNWKLVTMAGETALYDLAADIGESKDMKAEKPDIVQELRKAFEKWSLEMVEPLWGGRAAKPLKPDKKSKLR